MKLYCCRKKFSRRTDNKKDDFDRLLTGRDLLLRNEMEHKKYDASGKISAVEKVGNGDTRRFIKAFFENVDNVKTRVIILLVG